MRTVRVILATFLVLGLTLTLTPAHANPTAAVDDGSCQFSNAHISEPRVAVNEWEVVTIQVSATASGCESYSGADLDFNWRFSGFMHPTDEDPTVWAASLDIDPAVLVNVEAGDTLPGVLTFADGRTTRSLGASLVIQRAVYMSSFAPEKVKKNTSFWVEGGVFRADWELADVTGYANQKVRLQFQPKHGHYKTIKTVRTQRGEFAGFLDTKVKLKKSGCWRWVFDGSYSTHSAVSDGSFCTKVK